MHTRVIRSPEIQEPADRKAEVTRRTDPTIERGGCIIEAESGHVDATLASRIEAVTESLNLSDHQQGNELKD